MVDELYVPLSVIARLRHAGAWHRDVEVDWVRLGRTAPIAPYEELIADYALLSEAERADAERYMDELFSEEEYHILRDYLTGRGLDVDRSVIPIPMQVKPAAVGFIATPAQKTLALDQSGTFGWYRLGDPPEALPFDIAGMYWVGNRAGE